MNLKLVLTSRISSLIYLNELKECFYSLSSFQAVYHRFDCLLGLNSLTCFHFYHIKFSRTFIHRGRSQITILCFIMYFCRSISYFLSCRSNYSSFRSYFALSMCILMTIKVTEINRTTKVPIRTSEYSLV